ncbi:MAG TPA: carboxypeptidase regulatory-like domain-containing protein [Acidobacteriaceae bacterium]|nr:carboxypeptidase regulatory-like domain-containing protein [Acidobacteriaceae bacterium]
MAQSSVEVAAAPRNLTGKLTTQEGTPISGARVTLAAEGKRYVSETDAEGRFLLAGVPSGSYHLSVLQGLRVIAQPDPVQILSGSSALTITLASSGQRPLSIQVTAETQPATQAISSAEPATSGGEQLGSHAVSSLPLNKRDFSQLLLLAAGTMTDANGATNFTQQFAINGQRGVEATFAMDGADTSDPEMGGSTFSNFNVDAVEDIQSSSGWMPAEIGRGASGFTDIHTRSGRSGFHGSAFEFLRNSSLDARNYFDFAPPGSTERIPPFRRNEFGFTNGGPVILPHIYNGAGKTFYFGQYQGFRQVLGTTQVFPVPTEDQRQGIDQITIQKNGATTTDTLYVPVNSQIAAILGRYPMPNNPTGPYGANTYATSSKVVTNADQFSLRIDQQLSPKLQFLTRVNFDNLIGPTTNPDQTAIDPQFGIQYRDHQRNFVAAWTYTASPRLTSETSFSITRTTPAFPTPDQTDPAVKFIDGLFEPFDSAAGSVIASFANLFQVRQNFSLDHGSHAFKFGGEIRANRDSSFYGTSVNGEYNFGGGTSYAPVSIPSASGQNDVPQYGALPDTLSAFLTGSAFSYTIAVNPPYFSGGDHSGPAAINRNNFALYFQDSWKLSPRFSLDYGLRWDAYSPIVERARRTSSIAFLPDNKQEYVINPQPGYQYQKAGFEPRIQINARAWRDIQMHAGGGIMIIPPNIWQDNFLTGSTPFMVYPRLTPSVGKPINYGFKITSNQLPNVYTPDGQEIFPAQKPNQVAANTVMDVDRYEKEVAALSGGADVSPLVLSAIDPRFGNGHLYTWTLGLEKKFSNLTAAAAYVGTEASKLPRIGFPNGYAGADEAHAPYTTFENGVITGGFGTEQIITATSHSTYHALQTSLSGAVPHGGPGIQASYTWGKSIDDTSGVSGGYVSGATGAISSTFPQNPDDTQAERGPSAFDVSHAFTLSLAQDLHGDKIAFLSSLPRGFTGGWELLSISSINSGSPFTIYSGIQQTGEGSNGVDRPDQIGKPNLSTARKDRADYFGQGASNASYFYIPINIPGGTGPNSGRFGALGRNTFRGPAYYDYDFALIKDTPFGKRKSGVELVDLQFRGEFFNVFNIVNMGLPANIIAGSGFGEISRTAGTSRQIQFSLKVIY